MKVSIITVCFNSVATIKDTIESVIGQGYENIEYIIIDGNSNDGTNEIIRQYADKISFYMSETDKGIYDAMNKGINSATGDLIGILNSDDIYINNRVVSKMVANIGTCDGIYADLVYVDQFNLNKVKRIWRSGQYSKGSFKWGWMPPHPTFFLKKEQWLFKAFFVKKKPLTKKNHFSTTTKKTAFQSRFWPKSTYYGGCYILWGVLILPPSFVCRKNMFMSMNFVKKKGQKGPGLVIGTPKVH